MFTEIDYKDFLANTNLIDEKLAKLKKNERSMHFEISTKQDNFINFLLIRIDRENSQKNRLILLEKIFSLYLKEKFLYFFYNKIESFRNVDCSLNTIEELWKLYSKTLDLKNINFSNDIINNILLRIKDNSLYSIFYNSLSNPSNKTYFKISFTQKQQNLYLKEEELFNFIKVIYKYFEENYDTFFEDEEIYYLYIQEDKNRPNVYAHRGIKGKEVKEFIKKYKIDKRYENWRN